MWTWRSKRTRPRSARWSPSKPTAPARLLASGAPLARTLGVRPRLAVAGFVAGGRTALDQLQSDGPIRRGPRFAVSAYPIGARPVTVPAIEIAYSLSRVRADHARARPRTSTTGSGCCRASAATRCARYTRSRAESTTSATSRAASPSAKLAELRSRARRWSPRSTTAGPTPATRCESRWRTHGEHYALPLDALELLIEGVELDVHGISEYETFDELVALLPPRRRHDRPAVRRDLHRRRTRPTRTRAGRRPRRRDAADEHPARRPRGLRSSGGPTCRPRTSGGSAARTCAGADESARRRADPLRGRAGRRVVCPRDAAGGVAGPSQRLVPAGDDRHLPDGSSSGSSPTRRRCCAIACRCRRWAKGLVAAAALRGPGPPRGAAP